MRRRRLSLLFTAMVVVLAALSGLAFTRRGPAPAAYRAPAATSHRSSPVTDPAATSEPTTAAGAPAVAAATPLPPPAPAAPDVPVRLLIESIGVDAVVESVGLTPAGAMDVPRAWDDVGWLSPGPVPGLPGDSVIDGHLDSTTGPAVFIHLARVRLGDRVVVVLGSDTRRTFRVTGTTQVAAGSTAWSAGIFSGGPPRLILITCSGAWNRGQGQYQQRLVIQAAFVPDPATPRMERPGSPR